MPPTSTPSFKKKNVLYSNGIKINGMVIGQCGIDIF